MKRDHAAILACDRSWNFENLALMVNGKIVQGTGLQGHFSIVEHVNQCSGLTKIHHLGEKRGYPLCPYNHDLFIGNKWDNAFGLPFVL